MRLERQDIADLAYGAALLGTGGGGSPWIGRLALERILDGGGIIEAIAPAVLADDALVATVAIVGSPAVMTEKLLRGDEMGRALDLLSRAKGRPIDAVMPVEIGGLNSTLPLVAAASLGLKAVDADGMARAFPEVQMVSFGIAGIPASPMVLVNEHGDSVLLEVPDNRRMEGAARALCSAMGGVVHAASYCMTGAQVKRHAIAGTLGMAIRLGAAARRARAGGNSVTDTLLRLLSETGIYGSAARLAAGRIVDVERESGRGFSTGRIIVERQGGAEVEVEFRNENLVARSSGVTLAIVPDLICILDRDTATPIACDELRYGQRVELIAITAPAALRSPAAMRVVGPEGFGLPDPYVMIAATAPTMQGGSS